VGGWVETPAVLGGVHLLSDVLSPALPVPAHETGSNALEGALMAAAALAALAGIAAGLAWAGRGPNRKEEARIVEFLRRGWGFDDLYAALFVRPLRRLAEGVGREPLDRLYDTLAALARVGNRMLAPSQSGVLRRYAALIGAGAALLLAWGILR